MKRLLLLFVFVCSIGLSGWEWIPFNKEISRPEEPSITGLSFDRNSVSFRVNIHGVRYKTVETDWMIDGTGEEFVLFSLPLSAYTGDIGKPKLPMFTQVIEISHSAELEVRITNSKYEEIAITDLGIEKRIMPALASVPKIKGERPNFVLDMATYSTNKFYPEKLAMMEKHEGYARGHRVATVQLFPIQYNPESGKIRYYTEIELEVSFVGGDIEKTMDAIRKDYSQDWEDFIDRMVLNPNVFEDKGVVPLPIYYDIFYSSDFVAPAESLSNWKTQKGFKVRMWDATGWNATQIDDTVEAQTPLATYLVVISDPNASNPIPSGSASAYSGQTDLYYSETDGTGYLPDLFKGRISVMTLAEANIVVDKAIRYEKAIFGTAGYDWLKRATFIAGYCPYGNQVIGMATNWYCRNLLVNNAGYNPSDVDTLVIASGEEQTRVVNEINEGNIWMVYTAHGGVTEWSVGYTGALTVSELTSQTTNQDMYTMPCGHCCSANDFDYSTDCFGETWPKLSNRGGVSYFGSVPSSYWDEDDWLQRRYFDAIYADSVPGRLYETGRFTQWGLYWIENNTSTSRKQYYFEAYHVMNDPALQIWTDIPDNLQVTHNPAVPPGSSNFTVQVYDNDGITPIENALVCTWLPEDPPNYSEDHHSGYTDTSGWVTLSPAPDPVSIGDTAWVTVTKHDYIPYEGYAIVSGNYPPFKPELISLFGNAAIYIQTPSLSFFTTDNEGENIEYRVYWDTDPNFGTPDSSTTNIFPSGDTVNYTFTSVLLNGETYYWRVQARDPAGSGCWSVMSDRRSFTINTALPVNTASWLQQKGTQFNQNTYNGCQVSGDSIILTPGGETKDTILDEGFESGWPPSGWTVLEVGASSQQWGQATDYKHSGNYSAKVDYDLNSEEDTWLVTEARDLSSCSSCTLAYWQRGHWIPDYYEYWGLWVSTTSQTDTSTFTEVKEVGPGTEDVWEFEEVALSAYCGQSTVYLAFRYKETNGTDWWVDDITVLVPSSGATDSGTVTSIPISYNWLADGYDRLGHGWGEILWEKKDAADSIGIQVEHLSSGVWSLIPDLDIPNNSSGIFTESQVGELVIDNLDTGVYDTLRIIGRFYAPLTKSSTNPALLSWDVGNLGYTGIEEEVNTIPSRYALYQIKPNPLHSTGILEYAIPEKAEVELSIYDITGRNIITLVDKQQLPGYYQVTWNGRSSDGKELASGVYFIRMNANGKRFTQKAVLIR